MAADSDVVLNESLSNEAGDNEATDEGATTNEE
jgi:hypothetical protein